MVKEVSLIIPAFNEEEGIKAVLNDVIKEIQALSLTAEIIVVDDGSVDSTQPLVKSVVEAEEEGLVKLVTHKLNRGYGAALKTGILEAKYDTIVVIDADCTYPIEHLRDLLTAMDEADMVVGARMGEVIQMESIRVPAKWVLGKLASFLAEQDIPDLNSGFRVFNREIALNYFHILPNKFSFTTTITLAMLADDFVVSYVPINYYGRKGASKIRPVFAWHQLVLILKTIFYFNPLRVLVPLAGAVGLFGLVKLGFDLVVLENLTDSTVFLIFLTIQLLGFGLLADLIVRRT